MKRLALVVVLSLLSACATYPPPKIEGNSYQNYRYGFVLQLPGGNWKATKEVPDSMEIRMKTGVMFPRKPQLVLLNSETNGSIIIWCGKSEIQTKWLSAAAWGAPLGYEELDLIKKELTKSLDKQKEKALKQTNITDFTYEISPPSDWDNQRYEWTIRMDFGAGFMRLKYIEQAILYIVHDWEYLYVIKFLFHSNVATYTHNYTAFNNMLDTFKCGKIYTKESLEP